MKKSKHTPGPWTEQSQGRDLSYIRATKDGRLLLVAQVEVCETVDIVFINEADKQANARLIAAAPELLHLAEMILERLKDPKVAALWESPEEHAHEIEIYEAIIRKARGEL